MDAQSISSLCDDFFVDLYVNTELELPEARDTVLAFFERVQRQYPAMGRFYRRQEGEFWLEEDPGEGPIRWISLERNRIGSGWTNPGNLADVYEQHRFILGLIPYMLGVNHLDVESLDVCYAMDLMCSGSHDEVIADTFFNATAFGSLFDFPQAKPVGFSPVAILALSEDMHTQARVAVESKTSVYERMAPSKQGSDEAITLSMTVRQFPSSIEPFDTLASFQTQTELAESLLVERIVPHFIQPLIETIAQRRTC